MIARDYERYRFGPYVLEVNERELRRGESVVPLAGKAFDLLVALVRGAGRTVTKAELMAALWPDATVEENSLTQAVFVLRKALGEDTEEGGCIRTVPRHGYKFVLPVSVDGATGRAEDAGGATGGPRYTFRTRAWLLAVGVVIAIAVGAAGFLYLRPKQPVPVDLAAYRYRPFAYTQGSEHAGAWSPDGKNIAFLQGDVLEPENWMGGRLMLQPSGGGAATQLVEHVNVPPLHWSPDGTRIYFNQSGDVYSVSTAGGQPQFVVKGSGIISSFDLSPDGKALAIWRAPKSADGRVRGSVWISSAPGSEPHEYTPAPFAVPAGLASAVHFSPNGNLLYVSMVTLNGNGEEIWLLPFPAGTCPPRRIFRNAPLSSIVEASWMPDSRRLVFCASSAGSLAGLWLADIRDESLTKLTDGSGTQINPAVSPDGRRLLFTRVEEDADIIELPLDGSSPRRLLATGTFEYSPGWSPKGGEFAYLTRRNGSDELWLRSSPGDWERPIVTARDFSAPGGLLTPVISPDGSRIAYGAILKDPKRPVGSVYVSPRVGGTPTWIADGSGPSWSPDGSSIALVLNTKRPAALATLRVGANAQPFEIPNIACVPPLPVWSPSGEWIACGTEEGTVLVSPDGKKTRTLPLPKTGVLAWSKDGQTLYGLHDERGSWSLIAGDLRSGGIRKVADYGFAIYPYSWLPYFDLRLSLSSDGKSFAVGNLKRQTDLWILEGFPK